MNRHLQERALFSQLMKRKRRMKRGAREHIENRLPQRDDRRGERTHIKPQLNFPNHFRSERHLGETSLITNP